MPPMGGGEYGFGPGAVPTAGISSYGSGYGNDNLPLAVGSYGYGPGTVSTAGISPYGSGYGNDNLPLTGGSYGYGPGTAVSPAGISPYGAGYGSDNQPLAGGSYGYGPGTALSPAGISPYGGHGFGPLAVSPAMAGPYGGGYGLGPANVSPANAAPFGPVQTYGYDGYGKVSPLQTAVENKKPCNCGCKDKRETEPDEGEIKVELPQTRSVKPGSSRKPAKKPAVRTARVSQPRRRGSLPWINR
jgi:morphogenetic protein associated with SpoVID